MKIKRLTQIAVLATVGVIATSCGGVPAVRKAHAEEAIYTATIDGETKTKLTWAQSYDAVIAKTKVTSGVERNSYLHQAEDILMSTGAITPLYYYTDIFMKSEEMTGFYSSPLGYKFFQKAKVNGSGEYDICVGPKADTFDPAKNSAVDGAIVISHVYEGLYRWQQPETGMVSAALEPGQAASYVKSEPNEDGHVTYTFTLKSGLKFSDGSALKASDFANSWARAASGVTASDYGYMFDCIVGYTETSLDAENVVPLSGVVADDVAGTVAVEITGDLPYFLELTAFPTYAPVKLDLVSGDDWWTDTAKYVGNGPMKITTLDNVDGGSIVFEPNANYWDNANTQATKITFHLSDSDDNQLANFQNGAWKFIDSVPNAQIETLKAAGENVNFFILGQLGTYYIIFNVNDATLNDFVKPEVDLAKFRKALSLLLDRNYICEYIGQAGQEPANTFVGKGIMEKNGDVISEWTTKSGPNKDGAGYFKVGKDDYAANCTEAVQILKGLGFTYDKTSKQFTDIPAISYLYNTSSGHQRIAEYLQGALGLYGIELTIESQEWATFLNTRKDGNYSIARNGWLADYNDACSFLDMWTTNSGNNDAQFGR